MIVLFKQDLRGGDAVVFQTILSSQDDPSISFDLDHLDLKEESEVGFGLVWVSLSALHFLA